MRRVYRIETKRPQLVSEIVKAGGSRAVCSGNHVLTDHIFNKIELDACRPYIAGTYTDLDEEETLLWKNTY